LKQVSFTLTPFEAITLKQAAERNRSQRKKKTAALTRALKKLSVGIEPLTAPYPVSLILTAIEAEALQLNAGNYGHEKKRSKTLARAIHKIRMARWLVGIPISRPELVLE